MAGAWRPVVYHSNKPYVEPSQTYLILLTNATPQLAEKYKLNE